MVELILGTSPQRIFLPIPVQDITGTPELKARNTTDNSEVVFVVQAADVQGFLLWTRVALPEGLLAGEWEYTLSLLNAAGESIIATGLLSVKQSQSEPVQYGGAIEYKQYEG